MLIEINNIKCPTASELGRNVNWMIKMAIREDLRQSIYAEAIKYQKKETPKTIKVEANYKDFKKIGPCDLFTKPILSGLLKAGLLDDKDVENINWSCSVKMKMPSDKIIIYINE